MVDEFEMISNKAFKQEELEVNSDLATKYAYMQMKELYSNYKNAKINKEQASELKKKIYNEYYSNKSHIENYKSMLDSENKYKASYEEFLCNIEKSNNVNELLDNSLKFIEFIIKDKSFIDRNLKKLD